MPLESELPGLLRGRFQWSASLFVRLGYHVLRDVTVFDNEVLLPVQVGRWLWGRGRGGQRPLHASPVSISCWSWGPPSSPSLTPCPVPAQAGPAGAEHSGHSEHAHWPEGSAEGALFRVAGGLPAAPGPEVGRPALAWNVHDTLALGRQPALPLLTEPWHLALLWHLRVP